MRRNQVNIIMEILRLCLKGEKITHIIYKSNLNFKRFQAYLQYLVGKELLEIVEVPSGPKIYRTTDKGRLFLKLLVEE